MPVAGRIIRSAIAGFATLALFEVALQLLSLPVDGLYSGDIGYYWTLSPDYTDDVPYDDGTFRVEISELGIRDEGPPVDGPWVLALGCSTTFGWGVDASENWTERLQTELGVPVVNGGVPGHSTAQGIVFARDLLAMKPDVVLFGWGVRDSQLAPRPDSRATPSSMVSRLRIIRLMRELIAPSGAAIEHAGEELVERVSPEDFAQNMMDVHMVAASNGVTVVNLAFPMLSYPSLYSSELENLEGLFLAPQLPDSSFFEFDPVHLNSEGHQRLAIELAQPIMGLLEAG
jgi:lysophospholipase L1-like esterase